MRLKNWILVSTILLSSCCSKAQSETLDKNLYGVWNSVGYGQQLKISKKYSLLKDRYDSGCNINTKLPTANLDEFFDIIKLTKDSLQIKVGFTIYDYIKSKKSEFCKTTKNNPLSNFDALWETFNENYAFFYLHDVKWAELKNKYRKKISKKSTDIELYTVLDEMISELNDGHSYIDIPESLEKVIEDNDDEADNLRRKAIQTLIAKYIPNFKTYNRGIINWGFINDSISYIQFNDFEDLANYKIPNTLSNEDFENQYWEQADKSNNYSKDVLNSFKKQMEVIYNDIKSSKTCIIDVRFNGGGYDEIGLEILSYFTNKKEFAFTKKAKTDNGFTKPQTLFIQPNKNYYNGKTYILTSYQTASASETFVLASKNINNIVQIGSNTEGILSDILSKRLPNGWEYGLSNEIYENTNGISFEKYGIPADYNIDYKRDSREFYKRFLIELQTSDKAIEKVFELNK